VNPWDPQARAYAALQRYYVLIDPGSAENGWQEEHRFAALPQAQRTPGHWYRNAGEAGFIHYKPDGSGQFHETLPAGVDPNDVLVIPANARVPSMFDYLTGMLRGLVRTETSPEVKAMIADLTELSSPGHASRLAREVAGEGAELVRAGTDAVLSYLDQRLARMAGTGLVSSKVTGFDVAGMMLMNAVAHQVAAAKDAQETTLFRRMFDPSGVPSVAEMAARLIHDCFAQGRGEQVGIAIKAVRKGGDGTLQLAREQRPDGEHRGLDLDGYYDALQQAGIRFLAAWWGHQSALQVSTLSESDRATMEKTANAVEEKLIRVKTALMYAIKDLDETRLREKRALIGDFVAKGQPDQADLVLFDVIDSQLFYPPWFRAVLKDTASP
jgi:hypothetical protein